MMTPSSDREGQVLAWQRLLLLFVAALVLFCGLRWDSNGWLQQQLQPRLAAYGIHATTVTHDGDRLLLQEVTLDGVAIAGKPLQLEQIVVTPKWSSLLRLEPVARLSMRWQQAWLDTELKRVDDHQLAIRDLHLSLPLSMLTPLLPSLPVVLAGDVLCHGAVRVNIMQSLPEQPDLICDWQQATVTMGAKPKALGDYTLVVQGDTADWQWRLTGGDVAKVHGNGVVHSTKDHPLAEWRVDGSLTVQAGAGPLGAMVATLLGKQKHAISGSLGAPVLH